MPDPARTLTELGERYFRTQHTYDRTTRRSSASPSSTPSPATRAARPARRPRTRSPRSTPSSPRWTPLGSTRPAWSTRRAHRPVPGGGAGRPARAVGGRRVGEGVRQPAGARVPGRSAMTITDRDGADRYERRVAGLGAFFAALGERYTRRPPRAARRPRSASGTRSATSPGTWRATWTTTPCSRPPGRPARPASTRRCASGPGRRCARRCGRPWPRWRGRWRSCCPGPVRTTGWASPPSRRRGGLRRRRRPAHHDVPEPGRDPPDRAGHPRRAAAALAGGRPPALGVGDLPAIAERLRTDPALRFETREQIVEVAEQALRRAIVVQDTWFPRYEIPAASSRRSTRSTPRARRWRTTGRPRTTAAAPAHTAC